MNMSKQESDSDCEMFFLNAPNCSMMQLLLSIRINAALNRLSVQVTISTRSKASLMA